ncbi:MAG: hypothetical protein HWE25_00025 [Alphaproteobacteria bacterium]|nr:hypothetical protein [Alphaproteobacteria bacterium]
MKYGPKRGIAPSVGGPIRPALKLHAIIFGVLAIAGLGLLAYFMATSLVSSVGSAMLVAWAFVPIVAGTLVSFGGAISEGWGRYACYPALFGNLYLPYKMYIDPMDSFVGFALFIFPFFHWLLVFGAAAGLAAIDRPEKKGAG